ncbi:glycosylphosphatidylinositol anchor biosynthesis [Coemansia erecta]|uniref:Glycosylphosphatidylinositol anchor biosynthesis n=1 Tax=Coemansia erecta TaxID=147472 RepID=A0A9W7XYG9_9FUNG|nr:glycosylphosphatidylinositol anchor biosynthesis [Coemansia erecta]
MKIVPTRIGVPFLSRRRDGNAAASPSAHVVRDAAHNDGERSSSSSSGANSSTLAPEVSPGGGQTREPGAFTGTSASALANVSGRSEEARTRRPWRKLLYIKQEYPDDYVDGTFLMELQKNTNVRMYDYPIVVMQTAVVTQHISSIMVFIAVFINLYRGSLAGHVLLWFSSILTVLGFVFWDILSLYLHTPERRIVRFNLIKGCVLFALLLFGLSPILRTLTEDTSSDTIWAMTVIFFCVNLAFHDYSTGNLTNIRFPGSVSLNAAILASVLLASQLDSNLSVFAFLAFALEWFGLFPISRRYLRRVSAAASMTMAVLLALVAAVMFMYISRVVALLHLSCTLFVTFGCPLWLIWVQRYKNEIHGPWDEARPIVHHYYS